MGNETSVLSEYRICGESYAKIGLWNLYVAKRSSDEEETFTAFVAKLPSHGQVNHEFERAIERLKTLRHPSVLKYVNSCVSGEQIQLFVEYVIPLNQALPKQTEPEICSGLHSILSAINFLHSRAGIVHNNICKDAIFVGKNGEWKLGYFDVSCRASEASRSFLDKVRSLRNEKSIPPEDEDNAPMEPKFIYQRDMYSYGSLVEDTVPACIKSGMANASSFLEHATSQLLQKVPNRRGTAHSLLEHAFFKQPLLDIQDFLAEIPIKDNKTKEDLFRQLPSMLYSIPESIVGSKFANSLLSRIIVLNPIAQQYLLPHVLIPRSETNPGLFNTTNYKLFIVPIISRIFLVRDAQIRLILLEYFSHYVALMEKDHLAQHILPELLLGIKDTDDVVVASTLRALADLVPILGSETVIGGTRLKLFTHGMPKNSDIPNVEYVQIAKKESNDNQLKLTPPPSRPIALPERHEPDGGEDASQSPEKSDDNWSDWEADNDALDEDLKDADTQSIDVPTSPVALPTTESASAIEKAVPVTMKSEIDLAAFEIRVKPVEDEIDYFADMQPTITSAPSALVVTTESGKKAGQAISFSLQAADVKDDDNDGWNWDD